jgi:hypothetical protein
MEDWDVQQAAEAGFSVTLCSQLQLANEENVPQCISACLFGENISANEGWLYYISGLHV